MKAAQSLPRPENWQDFESLCKKLWGEIWNCPEIKKNGRSGQSQSGIDIYGIPAGAKGYYGIQCKGKSEFNNNKLTEKEINEEIEKAKLFEPELEKMYFATTALKNAKVETIVRKRNIEHKNKSLFEVHIYCWEDIVDLILENKSCYDYYVNSQTFRKRFSIKITFENGECEILGRPKFLKKLHIPKSKYQERQKAAEKLMSPLLKNQIKWQQKMWKDHGILDLGGFSATKYSEINRSFIGLKIAMLNNGSEPLEHLKLTLSFPNETVELSEDNEKKNGNYIVPLNRAIIHEMYIDKENCLVEIEPRKKILVGDDHFLSAPIFIKPIAKKNITKIHWKLVSKDFKDEGILSIIVEPEFDLKWIEVPDESTMLLDGSGGATIEDFMERIDDN